MKEIIIIALLSGTAIGVSSLIGIAFDSRPEMVTSSSGTQFVWGE